MKRHILAMKKPTLSSNHTVRTALDQAIAHLERRIRSDLDYWWQEWIPNLESPIEAVFAIWWEVVTYGDFIWRMDRSLRLVAQHELTVNENSYRLDFIVVNDDGDAAYAAYQKGLEAPGIAVELDGHDFHERTKEQVIHRDQRDRDLQSAGWKVFHFSGSEIMANPLRCVMEVMDYADQEFSRYRKRALDAGGPPLPSQAAGVSEGVGAD